MFGPFFKMGMDMTMLALEAQQVIALRLTRLALGGPAVAARETRRMVSEKAVAAVETGLHLAAGGSAHKVVRNYRRKVQANRDRLSANVTGRR
ncbi:MAG TPA: hypothetical protein PKA55_05185 [Rhodoblastus sp.]|nr:hypothetical protein [Rhodoblastus sp.]